MLVNDTSLVNTPILSMQAQGKIAYIKSAIIDPDSLKIVAFYLSGPLVDRKAENILDVKSIREYSRFGMVIDSIDELISSDDVVKIQKVLELNFGLIGLKVKTKKGSKLGRVAGFVFTSEDFMIHQLVVKRPALKAIMDPELLIPRREIVEVNDYAVIVKNEEKTILEKSLNEDFVPNFVNPFRKSEQDLAPIDTQNPADTDRQ